MKIAFIIVHVDTFRHFERVVRYLINDGHQVTIVVDRKNTGHPNSSDRALRVLLSETTAFTVEPWILRKDHWQKWLRLSRELINYSIFFRPRHPSMALRNRWKKYLRPRTWKIVGNPVIGRSLSRPLVTKTLALTEVLSPPVPGITSWLKQGRYDVVVASPYIAAHSVELEYIKAAKNLNLPTVVPVQSWDNLTTKGTFQIIPDLICVWNHALLDEAVNIHFIPKERILVTGSPTFDYWFEMQPTVDRNTFCKQIGLNPEKPFIIYLCSSRGMIADETGLLLEFSQILQQNPATKDIVILVRPHPLNMIDWAKISSDTIKVWPVKGEFTDMPESRQTYYHSLIYSIAAVGINTTAMVESAISDRPCITIIDERYKSAQGGMGHFQHLLNGDFLEIADSYEKAGDYLAKILEGHDVKKDQRRRFVKDFIRPCGLDKNASEIVAKAIIKTASGKDLHKG